MTEHITPELLLSAYAQGYFPMAESREGKGLRWFYPEARGILPLDDFHVPKSLAKFLKKAPFTYTVDAAFGEVIRACAEREDGTWINDEIIALYEALHARGFAHSVEVWAPKKSPLPLWEGERGRGALSSPPSQSPFAKASGDMPSLSRGEGNKELVGGLYGVSLAAAFFGESMFSREANASKAALVFLVERLKARGFTLLDAQYVNEHLKQFGIIEIPRADYLARLEAALAIACEFLVPSFP